MRRFNVLCCGRRWGKTELGIDRLFDGCVAGIPGQLVRPDLQARISGFREFEARLAPVIRSKDKQERHIELIGGGSIDVWSLDSPDAGRGRAYKRVVVDEAAMVPNLRHAWQESIRPQLTDYLGDAWFLSTPKGIASDFHELFQRGLDPLQSEWSSWHLPTSSNPHIVPSEIESARGDMTELAFAQEYLAQFVSWEGAVFRRIRDAVMDPLPTNVPAVVIGVDWGRTTDYTVFIAIGQHGHVLGMDRFRGVEYSIQRGRLAEFWRKHGSRSVIVAEANSMGGPVIEQLQHDGLPVHAFTTTAVSKSAIIEALALAFERGALRIPNDPVLMGELQAYEGKQTPSGMTRYSAPDGMHDDTVMALAMGWSGICLRNEAQADIQRRANQQSNPMRRSISPI